MNYEESTLNLTQHETKLEERYEALLPNQKEYYNYLVEKRNFDPANAVVIAADYGKNWRKMEPRLQEILEYNIDEWYSSIINLKNDIKEYRSWGDWYQAIIYYRVTQWKESLFLALQEIKSSHSYGYVELVGNFKTDEEFGRYLVEEQDYLYKFTHKDIIEFLSDNSKLKEPFGDYRYQIEEIVDYGKVAEHALYGWHGGAGISHYDKLYDPDHPDMWAYFYTE